MSDSTYDATFMWVPIVVGILELAFIVFMLVTMWKLYAKAGQAGWKGLIPFYNLFILLEIIGRPSWWFLLYFIPFANVAAAIINGIDLAKVFGRSTAFGVIALGLFPVVGYPILAFGKSTYTKPKTDTSSPQPRTQTPPIPQPPVPPTPPKA